MPLQDMRERQSYIFTLYLFPCLFCAVHKWMKRLETSAFEPGKRPIPKEERAAFFLLFILRDGSLRLQTCTSQLILIVPADYLKSNQHH